MAHEAEVGKVLRFHLFQHVVATFVVQPEPEKDRTGRQHEIAY